jgi:hypothetical protein
MATSVGSATNLLTIFKPPTTAKPAADPLKAMFVFKKIHEGGHLSQTSYPVYKESTGEPITCMPPWFEDLLSRDAIFIKLICIRIPDKWTVNTVALNNAINNLIEMKLINPGLDNEQKMVKTDVILLCNGCESGVESVSELRQKLPSVTFHINIDKTTDPADRRMMSVVLQHKTDAFKDMFIAKQQKLQENNLQLGNFEKSAEECSRVEFYYVESFSEDKKTINRQCVKISIDPSVNNPPLQTAINSVLLQVHGRLEEVDFYIACGHTPQATVKMIQRIMKTLTNNPYLFHPAVKVYFKYYYAGNDDTSRLREKFVDMVMGLDVFSGKNAKIQPVAAIKN